MNDTYQGNFLYNTYDKAEYFKKKLESDQERIMKTSSMMTKYKEEKQRYRGLSNPRNAIGAKSIDLRNYDPKISSAMKIEFQDKENE